LTTFKKISSAREQKSAGKLNQELSKAGEDA